MIAGLFWGIAGLTVGMVLAIEVGYRMGRRHRIADPERYLSGAGTLEAAVFALMSLLVAFTFSGAATRFEARRSLIVREANAIGTAYLRVDLVPAEAQPKLRDSFRTYLRSRLAVYEKIPDIQAVNAGLASSDALQLDIWRQAVAATRASGAAVQSLVLGSLNEMIDITTARTAALTTHPPTPVYVLLALTTLTSCVLAGDSLSVSESREWMPIVVFVLVLSIGFYMIFDYEYPRAGIIRIDSVDRLLTETLEQMK